MSAKSGGLDFDRLLERELQRRVGGLQGPSPAVEQAAYHAVCAPGGKRMSLLSSIAATASSKAAAARLATAALVIGGGSAAAAAATGSASPDAWGKTVSAAVTTCRHDLQAGQHGLGHCVSIVAQQKGQQERAAHAASSARQNPPAGTASHPAAASSAHPVGASSSHPAGASTPHPTGKPAGVPVGPPASVPPASGGSHPTGPPVTPPTPR